VFGEDVASNSPSAAASVVMARASNGRKNWQLETTGQTYADWRDTKLAALGADVGAPTTMMIMMSIMMVRRPRRRSSDCLRRWMCKDIDIHA